MKCKAMWIGRLKDSCPPHLKIQDKLGKTHTMPVQDKEKDLSIIIDDGLKFHLQTNTSANKANGVLSLIHQSFKYFSSKTLTQMYKTQVQLIIKYRNIAWGPSYIRDCTAMERIQCRATRMTPGLKRKPYEDCLKTLELPSLLYRRK